MASVQYPPASKELPQYKKQPSPLSVLGKYHFSVLLLISLVLYLGFWDDVYLCNVKS